MSFSAAPEHRGCCSLLLLAGHVPLTAISRLSHVQSDTVTVAITGAQVAIN